MTAPFIYPATVHMRRHGPNGYATYESYRPWLRDEFAFRCVFCLVRETWGPFRGQYAIDYFEPTVTDSDEPERYDNLLYSCVTCNAVKGDRGVPDPLVTLLDSSVWVERDGHIHAESAEAARLIELLDLNDARRVEFRLLWIEFFSLSSRYDPELHRRIAGYPDDLPDLSRLRPPGGNARPEGLAASYYARRQRGELAETY